MKKHVSHPDLVPTYIINLKKRSDRLNHIKKQFSDKPEFDIIIIEAISHSIGAIGLWESTINIVKMAQQRDLEYVLICEDDFQFTKKYNIKKLQHCISEAYKKECDVLLGGIHWFNSALKVAPDLFWVDVFTATHFMIIFRKFFSTVLEADFGPTDISDLKIADLTDNKLVIYPFISTQKEFGYSDITPQHSEAGHIDSLFKVTSKMLMQLNSVRKFYHAIPLAKFNIDDPDCRDVSIPTYIINLPERKDRLFHIKQQFELRLEFDTTIIEACKNENGAIGLWESFLKVINFALKDDHDVIIICQDDHEFTAAYSRDFLLKNIFEAHEHSADILSGGSVDFGLSVPLTAERYWVNQMQSSQFIIVYKKLFNEILKYQINVDEISYFPISELSINKMLLWPSISVQKDFGYSDVNPRYNEQKELISNISKRTTKRLRKINDAYLKYNEN